MRAPTVSFHLFVEVPVGRGGTRHDTSWAHALSEAAEAAAAAHETFVGQIPSGYSLDANTTYIEASILDHPSRLHGFLVKVGAVLDPLDEMKVE